MLPLENSTAGSVNAIYDLMMKHDFRIVRSVRLKVDHNLLVKPGAKRSDITDVQPWLDKVLDDPFGRTDSGAGAGIEFILLQIDDADQSAADLAVGRIRRV